MTLDELQAQVALDFDSSSTALSFENTEYLRRTKLINRFETLWAKRRNFVWNELLKATTLTLTANTTSVDLPADFTSRNIMLSQDGYIKIGAIWHKLIRRDELDTYDSSSPLAYLLGNDPQGFTLNTQPEYTEDKTVYLNYYTKYLATDTTGETEKALLTETTDITKCPNPFYLIYSTLAALYKSDDELDKGLDYERLAEEEMNQMLSNENLGAYQQQNYIMGIDEIGGYMELGDI